MGWRYRKSYKFGGFRINLSKSGIGYSCGIPGMRFTKMANGRERTTYSIPGTGFFYVEETSSKKKNNQNYTDSSLEDSSVLYEASADVEEYKNAEYDEFLTNIQKCKTKNDNYNLIMIIIGIMGLFFAPLLIIPLIMLIFRKCNEEQFKINTDYILDNFYEDYYERINSFFEELAQNDKIWAIEQKVSVSDSRYHSGADSSVKRQSVKLLKKCPPYIKTNIMPYYLTFKNNSFYFLPDRILLETKNKLKDIKYSELTLSFDKQQFIEDDRVPKDAWVVDKTWRFVNKNGSPDRRFKNNYQLPICYYSTVRFCSNSGLDILLHLSQHGSSSVAEIIYKNIVEKRLEFTFNL